MIVEAAAGEPNSQEPRNTAAISFPTRSMIAPVDAYNAGRICLGVEIDLLHLAFAVRRWLASNGRHSTVQECGRNIEEGPRFDIAKIEE